MTNEFELKKQ